MDGSERSAIQPLRAQRSTGRALQTGSVAYAIGMRFLSQCRSIGRRGEQVGCDDGR
jgi:hypothetical protein